MTDKEEFTYLKRAVHLLTNGWSVTELTGFINPRWGLNSWEWKKGKDHHAVSGQGNLAPLNKPLEIIADKLIEEANK